MGKCPAVPPKPLCRQMAAPCPPESSSGQTSGTNTSIRRPAIGSGPQSPDADARTIPASKLPSSHVDRRHMRAGTGKNVAESKLAKGHRRRDYNPWLAAGAQQVRSSWPAHLGVSRPLQKPDGPAMNIHRRAAGFLCPLVGGQGALEKDVYEYGYLRPQLVTASSR
jgi:hypothetical protein